MGPPLHSFVICSEKLHSMEQEMFDHYAKWMIVNTIKNKKNSDQHTFRLFLMIDIEKFLEFLLFL